MVYLTTVAVAQLVVIAGLLTLMHRERRAMNDTLLEVAGQHVNERRELVTRIQRPEYTPTAPVAREPRQLTEDELRRAGELARVGTVEG